MSLAMICAWSFLRSVVVAIAAAILGKGLAAGIATARPRGLTWAFLLAPYLVPQLLVGYAYSRLALALIHYPAWNEAAYWMLLLLKFFPAAVVIYVFAPPSPVSDEAIHCQRLVRPPGEPWHRRAREGATNWILGPGRAAIAAFAVVFLLAFQEFEIASLMGITSGDAHSPVSWTVWIFDAHAGGLPLAESLRYALLPLGFELLVLLPALAVLPSWMTPSLRTPEASSGSSVTRPLGGAFVLLAAMLLAGAPSVIVLRGAANGLGSLSTTLPMFREIVIGAVIAAAVAVLACVLARLVLSANQRGGGRRLAVAALGLPGLLGPLVLSLMILGLFQMPGLRRLSESLVPLLAALVLFVLPRAIVVLAVTGSTKRREGAHCAWLLAESPSAAQRSSAGRLIDDLDAKSLFWSAVLVWYWAYWEMIPSALLAPPSVMPFSVLLYNFMHYGQNAVLSTMLIGAIGLPIAAIVILSRLRPLFVRLVMR